jgi:Flp pilus assembly protein CpaB
MGRRTIIIILVVGVLLLVGVVLVVLLNQGQDSPPPDQPQEGLENGQIITDTLSVDSTGVENGTADSSTGVTMSEIPPNMIEVVVSLQTVPRGWQMTAAELTTDLRFPEEVGPDVLTNINDAIGLYARSDIYQGQTLTKNALINDLRLVVESSFGPSSLIPPGFVAQAVPMNRLSGVAYGFSEGDYVDVMISFVLQEIDAQFQTLLENSITFYLRDEEGNPILITIDPYGRFEDLPTGEVTHIAPSESKRRPILVSMILQNAKVVQVGTWQPDSPVSAATPTPEPTAEGGETTPTPFAGEFPTATPSPPDTLLLALLPQQQLLLKYAVESNANITFALRGVNDAQLYTIENVDFNYIKERFNITIPTNFEFTTEFIEVTPTPIVDPADTNNTPPEGGG